MEGVINRRRPPRLRGIVVVPNRRMLVRCDLIDRTLQGILSTISRALRPEESLSVSIPWLRVYYKAARFGAMLWLVTLTVLN